LGLNDVLAFTKVSYAVSREDRSEAVGEGPSNTFEGRSSGKFFEGHDVSEARVVFLRAGVGRVDRVGVGGGVMVVVDGGVGGVGGGGGGGSGDGCGGGGGGGAVVGGGCGDDRGGV